MNSFWEESMAAYDALAKKLLSRKEILAQILKYSVAEYANCSVEDIEKKYIEGEPQIDSVPLDDTTYIRGRNIELKSPNEGLITFDIIFDAILPIDGETAKFIINIEPQKTTLNLNYKLMKRAVYYASRLISSQKEREFEKDDYNKLKKIFSIWVCMNVQNYRADSIQEYRITEKILHGKFRDDVKNYDLLTIIVLNLGKNPTSHRLLDMLHLIFMEVKSSEEKESILKNDYGLRMSRDTRKELASMGGFMEPLLEIAVEQRLEQAVADTTVKVSAETEKNTLLKSIRNLMEATNWSAQKAMDVLKIPSNDRKKFISLLQNNIKD